MGSIKQIARYHLAEKPKKYPMLNYNCLHIYETPRCVKHCLQLRRRKQSKTQIVKTSGNIVIGKIVSKSKLKQVPLIDPYKLKRKGTDTYEDIRK